MMFVTVDGADQPVVWHPKRQKLYDVVRDFCVAHIWLSYRNLSHYRALQSHKHRLDVRAQLSSIRSASCESFGQFRFRWR